MGDFVAGPGGEGFRVEDGAVADAVFDFGFGEDDREDVFVGILILGVGGGGEFGEVEVDALFAVAGCADGCGEVADGGDVGLRKGLTGGWGVC